MEKNVIAQRVGVCYLGFSFIPVGRETGQFYPTVELDRCDSNPAQYERNRRLGHLVHALGRATSGAKLPSPGLCLNASKAESHLDSATISRAVCIGRQVQGTCLEPSFLSPCKGTSVASGKVDVTLPNAPSPHMQCSRTESSVDDLRTSRGVVSG